MSTGSALREAGSEGKLRGGLRMTLGLGGRAVSRAGESTQQGAKGSARNPLRWAEWSLQSVADTDSQENGKSRGSTCPGLLLQASAMGTFWRCQTEQKGGGSAP